jgi:beta-lysine 5,6-aminomutase alpha subunit
MKKYSNKLMIDWDKVGDCRRLAAEIIKPVQRYILRHSTASIERTVLRSFGIEGALNGMPLVNLIIDPLPKDMLRQGIAYWFGRALASTKIKPDKLAIAIAKGEVKLDKLSKVPFEKIKHAVSPLVKNAISKLDTSRKHKHQLVSRYTGEKVPLKYVIVATGNIYDDVAQAQAAAEAGADIVAVIRHTAQSLLDYVPDGITTEGFGGTYATQENFKVMRKGLDDIGKKLKRYIRLTNYSSGLCMAEIAIMGAYENLDYLLNDAMYGILFRDINMKRTFVDQYFSRLIIARSGITINTGEDNYLTTSDAYKNAHTVLASQFINEQFALNAKLKQGQMGLGHAFEIDPKIKDGFLFELAQAQLVREIFPHSPIKYMPPTKYMTGDIFFGNVQDALFNMVAIMTNQSIQLLGMPTEAIHNPYIQDRHWSLKNADYLFNNAENIGEEITFNPNGKIVRRARTVLDNALKFLTRVKNKGLMKSISSGLFADVKREENAGKGLDGVFQKSQKYWNPLEERLKG